MDRDRDRDTESDRDKDNGSWSPGAALAVDGALRLHGPLQADNHAEIEKSEGVYITRVDVTSRHPTYNDNISLLN
jgi:hypothetical protein